MESSQQAYDAALELYRDGTVFHNELIRAYNDGNTARQVRLTQSLRALAMPGLWEHWKSGNEPGMTEGHDHWKFYVVRGLKLDDDGFPTIVDYAALYAPHAGKPFTRPLLHPEEGFAVPIDRPAWQPRPYVGPRFRLIRALSPREIEKLLDEVERISLCKTREAALELIAVVLGIQ